MRGFFTSNGSSGGYGCGLVMLDTLFSMLVVRSLRQCSPDFIGHFPSLCEGKKHVRYRHPFEEFFDQIMIKRKDVIISNYKKLINIPVDYLHRIGTI